MGYSPRVVSCELSPMSIGPDVCRGAYYPAWFCLLYLPFPSLQFKVCKLVGVTGFEPATSASRTQRSHQAELHPAFFNAYRLI